MVAAIDLDDIVHYHGYSKCQSIWCWEVLDSAKLLCLCFDPQAAQTLNLLCLRIHNSPHWPPSLRTSVSFLGRTSLVFSLLAASLKKSFCGLAASINHQVVISESLQNLLLGALPRRDVRILPGIHRI